MRRDTRKWVEIKFIVLHFFNCQLYKVCGPTKLVLVLYLQKLICRKQRNVQSVSADRINYFPQNHQISCQRLQAASSGFCRPRFMAMLCKTQQVNIILHTYLSLQSRVLSLLVLKLSCVAFMTALEHSSCPSYCINVCQHIKLI